MVCAVVQFVLHKLAVAQRCTLQPDVAVLQSSSVLKTSFVRRCPWRSLRAGNLYQLVVFRRCRSFYVCVLRLRSRCRSLSFFHISLGDQSLRLSRTLRSRICERLPKAWFSERGKSVDGVRRCRCCCRARFALALVVYGRLELWCDSNKKCTVSSRYQKRVCSLVYVFHLNECIPRSKCHSG